MVSTTGTYHAADGRPLVIDKNGALALANDAANAPKLRPDKKFFLCEDDGLLGKYGTPKGVKAVIDGVSYRVWWEPRGPQQFGLIPTAEDGVYSNKFLSIKDGGLSIADDWGQDEVFTIRS